MFEIKQISADETYALRLKVLPHEHIEDCYYKGDFDGRTIHVGAFKENEIFGVASFFPEQHKQLKGNRMYRLRGLAIDPSHQNQLRGQALILFGENLLRQYNTELIWAVTKVSNIQYYEHLGFEQTDYMFNDPMKGLRVLMSKSI